jgi:hypothetical protein
MVQQIGRIKYLYFRTAKKGINFNKIDIYMKFIMTYHKNDMLKNKERGKIYEEK